LPLQHIIAAAAEEAASSAVGFCLFNGRSDRRRSDRRRFNFTRSSVCIVLAAWSLM
jgi:hypothetical protein